LSAIAAVAAILGSLVVMETATVKLVVPATKLVANVTFKGGPHGQDLVTTTIQADVSDSAQGTASTLQVAAIPATGLATFTCSPCSPNEMPIPFGTTVSTVAGVHYDVAPASITPPHTFVQVPIRALVPGKAGNTAANTVTVIDKPIPNVKVTNPQPITGGTDPTSNQVIQQSDLDRVQLALTAKVTQDIEAALKAQAEGLNYLTDGQPTLKVTADHKVGDQVATFNMTITATLNPWMGALLSVVIIVVAYFVAGTLPSDQRRAREAARAGGGRPRFRLRRPSHRHHHPRADHRGRRV